MSNWKFALLTALAVAGGAALAKLPPPTPEEQKAAAEEKRLKAEQMRKEKEALERAQDRVVEHYRRSRSSAPGGGKEAGKTRAEDMPKTTGEPAGGVGPRPQSPPSAEAHSGENR